MGLSEAVSSALDEAARLVYDLVQKLLRGEKLEEALENSAKGTT